MWTTVWTMVEAGPCPLLRGMLVEISDNMSVRLNELASFKGHTTLFWNSRSLLNKIEEIDCIVIEASPELIGITEFWLTSQIDNQQVAIDGYSIHRLDRSCLDKLGGGGLVWFTKTQLNAQPLPELNNCANNMECLWVKLIFPQTKPVYYGLIYRPPDGNITEFLNELDSVIIELPSRSRCEINICEDFNIDMLKAPRCEN